MQELETAIALSHQTKIDLVACALSVGLCACTAYNVISAGKSLQGWNSHLIDSWPDLCLGKNARFYLLWAEIADANALDQALLYTLLKSSPGFLKWRVHLWAWLHRCWPERHAHTVKLQTCVPAATSHC